MGNLLVRADHVRKMRGTNDMVRDLNGGDGLILVFGFE